MELSSLFSKELLKKTHTEYSFFWINLSIRYPLIVIYFITKARMAEKYTEQGYITPDKHTPSTYPIKICVILKQNIQFGDKVSDRGAQVRWYIKPNIVIVQIIPLYSKYVVELYDPVKNSGFLKLIDQILSIMMFILTHNSMKE